MTLVSPLALVLPWLELLTALGLIFGVARRGAALPIMVLLLVFMGGLGINLSRHNPVDCGCFGASKIQKTKEEKFFDMKLALLRDLGLALLALHALTAPERKSP